MPIYEYACARCESEFEVEQRITDEPLKTCPRCRSRRIKRLISQTSFTLRGGGWYADGYSGKGGAKSDSAKSDGGDSAPASTSDSAPSSGASGSEKKGEIAAKGKNAPKGKKAVA